MIVFAQGVQPPTSPWTPPASVVSTIWSWLEIALYVAIVVSILAVITLGAFMALDKDRGEPVSATAPYVTAVKSALGVLMFSSAVALATAFS